MSISPAILPFLLRSLKFLKLKSWGGEVEVNQDSQQVPENASILAFI